MNASEMWNILVSVFVHSCSNPSEKKSVTLKKTNKSQFVVFESTSRHVFMCYPEKLDRHKPWPSLPFPPLTEVTVSPVYFHYFQHSFAVQSRQAYGCRGCFSPQPQEFMLAWLEDMECLSLNSVYVASDGGVQELRNICDMTFLLLWVTKLPYSCLSVQI